MADAPDLGSGAREGVGVQVSLLVPLTPWCLYRGVFYLVYGIIFNTDEIATSWRLWRHPYGAMTQRVSSLRVAYDSLSRFRRGSNPKPNHQMLIPRNPNLFAVNQLRVGGQMQGLRNLGIKHQSLVSAEILVIFFK